MREDRLSTSRCSQFFFARQERSGDSLEREKKQFPVPASFAMPPKGSTKQPQMKAYTSYTFKEVTYEGQLLEGRGKRKKKRKEKGRGIRRPLALSSSPPRSHLETLPKKHEQQLERTSTSSVTTEKGQRYR